MTHPNPEENVKHNTINSNCNIPVAARRRGYIDPGVVLKSPQTKTGIRCSQCFASSSFCLSSGGMQKTGRLALFCYVRGSDRETMRLYVRATFYFYFFEETQLGKLCFFKK